MSNYRCPICGANHKQYQPQCRLCGQSLSAENIPTNSPKAATAVGANSSIKGVFWVGLLIVIVLLAGAVAFGVVQSNRAIETAKEVVLQDHIDGWSPLVCSSGGTSTEAAATCTVPAGQGFTVELPGDRTKSVTPFAPASGQKMETWSTTVSTDTVLEVIFAPVTDPQTGAVPAQDDKVAFDRIADAWMATKGLDRSVDTTGDSKVDIEETTFRGYPARIITTPASDVTYNNQDAYLQTMLVLRKDVLFVVQTTSIYDDAEQFDRMKQTLVFT